MDNPSLTWESLDVLIRWQPNLEPLVNGHGDEVVISEGDVVSVSNYLHLLGE